MQRDIPLLDPPSGVKSNFKDPESWAYESIATTAVCFSLMLPFFVLRIYARAFITRSLGWDDCKSKMRDQREGIPSFFFFFFCFVLANLLKKKDTCALGVVEIPKFHDQKRKLTETLVDECHRLCRCIYK